MRALARFLLTLIIAFPLLAQSTATLHGRVFDASDAVIPGATVSVRNRPTSFEQAVPTDNEGRYHVAAIPPAHTS